MSEYNLNFENWWLKDPLFKNEPKSKLFGKISLEKFTQTLIKLEIINLPRPNWIVYTFWENYKKHREELTQYYQDIRFSEKI